MARCYALETRSHAQYGDATERGGGRDVPPTHRPLYQSVLGDCVRQDGRADGPEGTRRLVRLAWRLGSSASGPPTRPSAMSRSAR
eukprot:6193622-Pleurochrysis_carterae.AAC.1